MDTAKNVSLTYADAGVNISAGNTFVDQIKPIAQKTHRPGVLAGLGGFGALFELPLDRFQKPVLVSATDGVGTKLKLAQMMHKHDTIGIDLVAMCVNDIIVQGAEPLFFLDYFASGHLDVAVATEIVRGIGEGCEQAGAALIGGETAEMPGLYQGEDYDLAGFSVGIVEKDKIIDGRAVQPGDVVIGLASSGPHANGFSLIRKIIAREKADLQTVFENGKTLGEILLTPTRIYVKPLLKLMKTIEIHAMAHITGGGLLENIPRVLPAFTQAQLCLSSSNDTDKNQWTMPPIFRWLQEKGQISTTEMYRTFNCGIGMVIIASEQQAALALQQLKDMGETAWRIGNIQKSTHQKSEVIL